MKTPNTPNSALLLGILATLLACGGTTVGAPSNAIDQASPSVEESDEEEPEEELEETVEPANDIDSFAETYLEVITGMNENVAAALAELERTDLDEEARHFGIINLASAYAGGADGLESYIFTDEVQEDVDELVGELNTIARHLDEASYYPSESLDDILAARSRISEIGARLREMAGLPPPSTPDTP